MKITILCVGKVKEAFYRDAILEFSKRLSSYCKLEIIEVPDEKTPEKASDLEKERILQKEGEAILRFVKDDAYLCTLEIQGKQMDSVAFSNELKERMVNGISHIQFVIGGSLGLHTCVTRRSDLALSFSKMTFPHQLMRVILLEQIYRAFRILSGEPYHK